MPKLKRPKFRIEKSVADACTPIKKTTHWCVFHCEDPAEVLDGGLQTGDRDRSGCYCPLQPALVGTLRSYNWTLAHTAECPVMYFFVFVIVVVIAHYNPLWSGHNLLACVASVLQLSPHTTVCPVMSFVIVFVCCICNIVFTCICLLLLPITLKLWSYT